MKKYYPVNRYLFAVLLSVSALFSFAQPAGWSVFRAVTATETSGSTLTNYPVKLVLNTQALIAAGLMNADGSDIRFFNDCQGTTPYSFFIDTGINTTATVIWVKVPSLPANSAVTFYMFYGNPLATSTSSPSAVFNGPNSATDSVTASNTGNYDGSQRGFNFTANQNVLVTSFGKFEPDGNDKYVTLFDEATNNILAQVIVSGGAGGYHYANLATPVWLTAGTNYVLAIFQDAGENYYFRVTSQIGQAFTYNNMQYCNGCDQNTFPTDVLNNYHAGIPDMWYYIRQVASSEPTVSIGPVPLTLTTSGPTQFCPGETVDLIASGAVSYVWSTTETTSTITVSLPNTYTVTATNAAGCTVEGSVDVTNFPQPSTNLGGPYAVCPGTSVLLDAGVFASYIWSDASTAQTLTVTVPNTYSVTVTDANGCTASSSAVVNAAPGTSVTINGPGVLCSGGSGTLNAVSPAGSFLWNTGETTPSININSIGTYSVTVTDGNGCTASSSHVVAAGGDMSVTGSLLPGDNLLPGPRMFRDGTPTSCAVNACNGTFGTSGYFYDTYTLVNSGPIDRCVTITSSAICQGGDDYFISAYSGSFDPNNICTNYLSDEGLGGLTFDVNIVAGTSAILVVNQVNDGGSPGCSSYTLNITGLNPIVSVSPSGPTTFCSYQSVDLTAGGASTYAWNSGQNTATITVNTSNTYVVTGTDVNGCTATDAEVVTVNTAPTVNLGGPYSICPGGSIVLDAGNAGASYLWSDASTAQTLTVTVPNTYSVTVTDGNACTGSASAQVNAAAGTSVSITGPSVLCGGGSGTLTAVTTATTYLWSTGATTSSIGINSIGTYSVTVTDAGSCTGSASYVVAAGSDMSVTGSLLTGDNTLPGPRMFRDGVAKGCAANACPGVFAGSGFFYDTYTLVNSGLTDRCVTIASSATCQGGDEYFVSAYNGTFDPNNICTNYLSDEGVGGQTFSVNIAAGTSVILVVNQVNTGFAGCNSYTLNITGLTPVVTITPSGPTTFCSYDNVDLQAAGANTYVWNTGATGDLITVNGTNTYIVTGTDVNGCTAQASQAVTVNAAPAPNLGGPYVQCSGGSVTLDAGVYASYQWNDASTNQTLTVSSNGTYSVIVTDNNGCTGFSSADVTFSSPPPVNMTGTTELCAGATGTVQVTTAAASYLWNTGSTSSSITVNTPGTYTVTITDVSTCTGSGSWVVSASGNFSVTGSLAAGDNIITGARMSLDGIPKNCGVNVCPGATGPAGVYYDSYSIVNHGPTAMCATASLNATCGGNIFAAAYLTTFNPGSVCANYIADKGNAFAGTTFSFTIPANSTVIVVVSETQGGHPGCGSYTLNVTGVTANVTITPSGSTTLCSYQSVNLTAGGANTYVWNTGPTTPTISVNTTNTYTVTGTDFNGCTASASRSVVVNSAPTPSLGGPYTQCGGFVVLDPGFYLGGYLWNDGTGSQVKLAMSTGTYAVTVTDGNGCTGSASANVTIHPLPVVDLGGPYEQCQGTVTLDAGNPGSSYIWNDGVTTTQTQVASTTGDYQVTVTDNNNCTASGATFVTIDLPPLNTTGYTICQGSQVPAGQGLMASGCGDVSPSFAGRITLADPTFHRSNVGTTYTPSNVGTAVHYVTHPFAVGTSGSYTFTLCGNFDAYLHIYTDPFNPAFPGTNFLAADDDAAICAGGSEITLNLAAGVQYVFVASGYGNNDVGNYTGTFTGPGPVYEGAINAPVWFGQSTGGPLLGTGSPFNPVGTSAVPNTNTPGTYTLYVACPNTPDCRTPVDFVIDPSPTINLGGPYNQCGGSVTLNAGPGASYTYSWTDGATTQTTVATTSGNYGVTVTNGFTCSATADVDVYIQNVPVVNLGLDRTQCGGTVTLDAGNPGNQFIWSDGSTNQTLTVAFGGIYSVTVGDAFTNCTASDGVNVTINQPPVVNLGGPYQQCGGSVTLDAGNVGSTYVWSTGVVTQTITVTNSGTYRVTVTNANTCSATGSANVTIDQYPTLGPDKADSVCPGFTVDLRTYYANTYASYNWSAANPAAAGPGTYTLIVATGAGCADTAMVVITERQHPDLGPDIADSICIGYTFDLWTLYPNNASYTSYVWNTPTPQQVTAGTYTLVVTNASGCMDTVVATITNRQQPSLGPDQADSVCMGFTVDLTTYFPDNGYATYVWNTATPDSVGPGVYQLIVSYGSGCSDTAIMTVIQRQQPVVTLTMAHEMCYTDPAFTLTGGLPVGGIYVINDTLTTFTFDPVALGIGIHRINYIYTNASGCTDSAQVLFTVHPQPNITTIAPPDLCTGSTAIDLDNYFTPLGGVYSGFGVSQHFFYPSITGPVDSNIITYLYTDQFGCKDTSLYPITVKGTVHVSMNVSEVDYTICQGDSITFTASGAEMYEFFINGVSQGVDSVNVLTTTTLNNHDEIFVVGSNSCSSDTSDDVFIDVITLPTVDAGPDTAINLGESIVLTTKATGTGLLLYQWDPNYFLNFTNVPNPTFNGPDTTTFTVRVTDTYGCWGSDTITVNVIIPDNILLPNVMTPDGDGKNDIWKLNPKINLDGSHLIIFNRWGETVYEADSYTNDWDGTYKGTGKKLPDDTYYYVLKVPAQNNHLYKGAINILNGSK